MGTLENIYTVVRNRVLNSMGVERDLTQLILDKDISRAKLLFEDNELKVKEAIEEYNPGTHKVMHRADKPRKGKEPYITEKLPRALQRYINEIAVFFMYGNPVKWYNDTKEDTGDAFAEFVSFLDLTRFNTTQRQAKRIAGYETESAKLYHIYQNDNGKPAVKVVILSRTEGYMLHPLFDQYKKLVAFGYGYNLKEGAKTVEHFDIQTPDYIYRCKKLSVGWEVDALVNPTGKINVIYNKQKKEWDGTEARINRIEHVDSIAADTNNYFANPKAKLSADVIDSLADPNTVGEVIRCQGKDSVFEYIAPPSYSDMKEAEKKDLKDSVLYDSFTPDLSYENMKGTGTLSGEALKRALILGYIKRDINKEVYDINIDREKNLILAIMMNVTHIEMREQLAKLNIKHEFAEPFNEDQDKRWAAIGKAYSDGIISLDKAVELMGLVSDKQEEIDRILAKLQPEPDKNKDDEEIS